MPYKKTEYLVTNGEQGSALVYILIAIALLAALTITFMEPSSQQSTAQNSFKTAADLKSQIDYIQSTIQECVLYYGDKGDETARDEGYQLNAPYPLLPSSAYFDNHSVDPDNISTDEVRYIRCPGNPGNNPDHAEIFSGSSGKFLAPPPDLFEEWMYYSGDDGVFIWIKTEKTDQFLQSAIEKLDEQFADCESDIITASSGSSVDMDSDSPDIARCSGSSSDATCFRVWFKQEASAVYPDDTSCP